MNPSYDLIGIGIGPFNLSLAALLEKTPQLKSVFFDRKPKFDWHPELMFGDAVMQTSYFKDLVTPIDPTSPYSFLNYLVENSLFYPFLNTQRTSVSRREFEQYCSWATRKLEGRLQFETGTQNVTFDGDQFQVETTKGTFRSRNICIATGLTPRIPEAAKPLLGPNLFHAKSEYLKSLQLEGKSVAIVGGGQTGIEVFQNAIFGKWGRTTDVRLLTSRKSLEPLDESPFTNEYFTPNYVDQFWNLSIEKKAQIVADQKLASDGNTPSYLLKLYNDLYQLKYVDRDPRDLSILASRRVTQVELLLGGSQEKYKITMRNSFLDKEESLTADVVILCTGFESVIPKFLDPILPRLSLDAVGRFKFKKSYALEWDGPEQNRIYAMNYSRHNHGIMDPQTSLMAWRSAVIINDLARTQIYQTQQTHPNFIEYGTISESATTGAF